MPIIMRSIPTEVRQAYNAYMRSQRSDTGEMAAVNRFQAAETTDPSRTILLQYPHVYVNVHKPDDPRNLTPYAWQIIYGTRERPVSIEVAAATRGDETDAGKVHGPRLTQTVEAVMKAIADHDGNGTNTTISVLHIRSIGFRAVILQRKTIALSIAIPLPPMPKSLESRAEWPLDELIIALRTIVPTRTTE